MPATYSASGQYKHTRYLRGICVNCNNPRDSVKYLCATCRQATAKYKKRLREKRKENGMCANCGATPEVFEGVPICLICWFKRISIAITGSRKYANPLHVLWNNQRGLCAYSDIPLVPGRNASIDHKIPKSLGGSNDVSNLQWVTKNINRLKGKLTHAEFVALCHHIAVKYV